MKQKLIEAIEEMSMFTEEGDSVLYTKETIDLINQHTEGMVLVPREPTEAMIDVMVSALERSVLYDHPCPSPMNSCVEIYKAMIKQGEEG